MQKLTVRDGSKRTIEELKRPGHVTGFFIFEIRDFRLQIYESRRTRSPINRPVRRWNAIAKWSITTRLFLLQTSEQMFAGNALHVRKKAFSHIAISAAAPGRAIFPDSFFARESRECSRMDQKSDLFV
jgi:hypothetical protein